MEARPWAGLGDRRQSVDTISKKLPGGGRHQSWGVESPGGQGTSLPETLRYNTDRQV